MKNLIKGYENIISQKPIMFCFPFAGGGAGAYSSWINYFQENVVVCPIQLPGREEKIMETPYVDMKVLIEDLVQEINKYNQHKIIIFGHSMGAKIAYEVAKRLEFKNHSVEQLIVSGSRVPHILEPDPIYHLPDEEFEKELARFEGTPKEILENKELLKFFLPMLRADFTMDETYCISEVVKLSCPILALGGTLDKEAYEEDILKWNEYTKSDFAICMFEGGHFFIKDKEEEVKNKIFHIIKDF
ncbi:thioesterase [Clostridium botulinum]